MSTTAIPEPRTRYQRTGRSGLNFEMLSWLFMRISGVALVFLIFGHLFVNLWLPDGGVRAVDFGFVAGKWASPFWQVWDLLMLWLGLIHGTNGVRTIINDYARGPRLRIWLKLALYVAVVITLLFGTLTIFTFDPCPAGANPELLPSICQG